MWELIICFSRANYKYAKLLHTKLSSKFKNSKSLCTLTQEEDNIKLLIACEKQKRSRVTKLLDDFLAEIIVTEQKEEFLKANLKLGNVSKTNLKIFIKALVCFDKEYDKEFVIKKLNYNNDLFLESFYAFKLVDLKKKWKDICNLTNDNAVFLTTKDIFLELLKFLVSNLTIKNDIVQVIFNKNKIKFLDEQNNSLKLKNSKKEKIDEFLLTSLIKLSPKNIKIISDGSIKLETINLINNLFTGRVMFEKLKN
jgi:hypothetical protein